MTGLLVVMNLDRPAAVATMVVSAMVTIACTVVVALRGDRS